MSFRFVSKLVTLNDLERRNGRDFAFFPPNSLPIGADYVKVVEDTPRLSATKMQPKESSFQRCITYGDIRRGYRERGHYRETPMRRALSKSANMTNTASMGTGETPVTEIRYI